MRDNALLSADWRQDSNDAYALLLATVEKGELAVGVTLLRERSQRRVELEDNFFFRLIVACQR